MGGNRKPKYSEINLPQYHSPHQKFHMECSMIKLAFHGAKPATNYVRYGTSICLESQYANQSNSQLNERETKSLL
jgi:hypothetical protein